MLTASYTIIFYGNIIFDLHPLFQERNLGGRQGLCVYN